MQHPTQALGATLQKPFRRADSAKRPGWYDVRGVCARRHTALADATTPDAANIAAEGSADRQAASGRATLEPQALPPFQLALEPQHALFLLAQLALRPLRRQLAGRVARLQLVDRRQQARDLVARFGQVLRERCVLLVPTLDLRLQVLDLSVNRAHASGFGGTLCECRFKRGFELWTVLVCLF